MLTQSTTSTNPITMSDNNVLFVSFSTNNNTQANNTLNNTPEESDSSITQYKVSAPILDDEYLNTPIYKKPRERVQPIPTEYIPLVREYFHRPSRYKANNLRNYAYYLFDLNVARRSGDAVKTKIKDVLNEDGTLKSHVTFHEEKTGKTTVVPFNSIAQEAIMEYLNTKESYKMSDYLFQNYKTGERITVDGMRKVIKRMGKELNIPVNLGTHSLRKTFVTEAIKNNPNDSTVEIMASKALNHSRVETTYNYICFSQADMDKFFEDNALR